MVWNVDPLPLSVPVSLAPLLDDALDDAVLPVDALLLLDEDEEHAARDRAVATTATPTVVTCCLRRNAIFGYSFMGFTCSSAAMSSPGRPVSVQTVVCEYSLSAQLVPAGKPMVDK